MGEEAAKGTSKEKGWQLPHQATLFLPGALAGGVFRSERLPGGVGIRLGGRALADPEGEAGEGIFSLWPRTDGEGALLEVQVAARLREPYGGPEAVAQGILIWVDRDKLSLLIVPKAGQPFPVTFLRDRGFTARLERKRAYRVEGRLEGGRLVAEKAWPLGKYLGAKWRGEPPPPAIAGRENPYLAGAERGEKSAQPQAQAKPEQAPTPKPKAPRRRVRVRVQRAPEEPEDPAPLDLGRPPALKRGQLMGIAGAGPFYLVLLPQAVPEWWPKVEARLPELTRRHEVRIYPDGSRAVVCGDLEALKVWYERVLRG